MFDGGDKIAVVLVWKVPILFKKLCLWLQGVRDDGAEFGARDASCNHL